MEKLTPLELRSRAATAGWVGILAVAGVYDYYAPETLSHGFKRALKAHPITTTVAYGFMTAHLFGLIPEKIDPLTQGLNLIKRV